MVEPPFEIQSVLNDYPAPIRKKLVQLRKLILEAAAEIADLEPITETLKWGEPSFVCKTGSTIRIGAPKGNLKTYALYFNCQTKLIRTFKRLYPTTLSYEGNRAVVFDVLQTLPSKELKHCIKLSLQYHKLKNKPPFTRAR